MGTTFGMAAVYGMEAGAAAELRCSEAGAGWHRTMVALSGQDAVARTARQLSAQTGRPVLGAVYYDDDYLALSLYRSGRRLDRHVPAAYENLPRKKGREAVWAEALALDAARKDALGQVFRSTDPEACLRLVSVLLGCNLLPPGEPLPAPAELTAYLASRAVPKKCPGTTVLTLRSEVFGRFGMASYPAVETDPVTGTQWVWRLRDGELLRVGPLPETEEPVWATGIAEDGGWCLVRRSVGDQSWPLLLNPAGESRRLPGSGWHGCFLPGARVLLDGRCQSLQTGEALWQLDGDTSWSACCTLADGTVVLAQHISRAQDPILRLETRTPEGAVLASFTLPGRFYWRSPVAVGDRFCFGSGAEVVCYDRLLRVCWCTELPDTLTAETRAAADSEMLYTGFSGGICAIRLSDGALTAAKLERQLDLWGVLPGTGPVMSAGGAALEVWNPALEPVSRHRLRGRLRAVLQRDGETCLLTHQQEAFTMVKGMPQWSPGALRLYTLKRRN